MTRVFGHRDLHELWQPRNSAGKFEGGQVTIVGGSKLFHGAPILSLKAASRIVDMVYFASFAKDKAVAKQLKASLSSFIWIPREELVKYLAKSDAALVGPGLMRYSHEGGHNGKTLDDEGEYTFGLTNKILKQFPKLTWVVDGGSLQVITPDILPRGCIITPNHKEFSLLFGQDIEPDDVKKTEAQVAKLAKKYQITIVTKGTESVISNGQETYQVQGGNAGLIKGGTGDVIAGLAVAFLAKNPPLLAAATAVYLVKRAADDLASTRALMYNADDLVDQIPQSYADRLRKP